MSRALSLLCKRCGKRRLRRFTTSRRLKQFLKRARCSSTVYVLVQRFHRISGFYSANTLNSIRVRVSAVCECRWLRFKFGNMFEMHLVSSHSIVLFMMIFCHRCSLQFHLRCHFRTHCRELKKEDARSRRCDDHNLFYNYEFSLSSMTMFLALELWPSLAGVF